MSELASFTQFLEDRFRNQIRSHTFLEAEKGECFPFPDSLDPRLQEVLRSQNITSLYSHQRQAFEYIRRGENTVLISQTASGKTLSFLIPILNEYLNASTPFSVLLLYPTKALSRDQEGTLGELMRTATGTLKFGTFDGDTPRAERVGIQRAADFVLSNPDMLHSGILPNHTRFWKNFLSRLRFVVIDEVHLYRGAFGSHVANVFRRLLRVCEIHGSRPCFICSSATVSNPQEHVSALFHQSFHVIDQDGAPRPRRDLYMINPPLIQSHGYTRYRKGPSSVSIPLIRQATKLDIRTICFCRARQQVERLYRAVSDGYPHLKDKIKPYRGGLLPNERRKLERDLFGGKLTTIITTNALELGINIGNLDICILCGHPGTIASFRQQAGRVGRRGSRALTVFIANNTPIDQYLVHHPEFVTSKPVEKAWLNADNPYIILQHLPCSAHEHPLRKDEKYFEPLSYNAAIEILTGDKTLVPYRDVFRYALPDYPTRGVSLRGMTDYNVEIYCGSVVIGEIDPIGARGTLYKDAIYQHLGKRYISLELSLEKKLCHVEEVNVDYFTEAVWEGRVTLTEAEETTEHYDAKLVFGQINVNRQPKLYKKIRERTYENIGYGPITLEPFIYDTTGFSIRPSKKWLKTVRKADARYIGAALYGLSYILKRSAPSLCMADINDINTDVALSEHDKGPWDSVLYLFDTHEGGVGYAEKIFESIKSAFELSYRIICQCDCQSGCPACIPPLPPGVSDEELEMLFIESNAATQCTRSLLKSLMDGSIVVPEVAFQKRGTVEQIPSDPKNQELKRLNVKLTRAANVLQEKRARLH